MQKLKKKKKKSSLVFIGIGTNKGNRHENILFALNELKKNRSIKVLKVSSMLKNPPQEGIKTGYFLNGAIKLLTSLTPLKLLKVCQSIEKKLGRNLNPQTKYSFKKTYKPRTIDLDILFYGNRLIKSKDLIIPHPKLHKRYFVLIPLIEIGRNHIHPKLNKSILELYFNLIKIYKATA